MVCRRFCCGSFTLRPFVVACGRSVPLPRSACGVLWELLSVVALLHLSSAAAHAQAEGSRAVWRASVAAFQRPFWGRRLLRLLFPPHLPATLCHVRACCTAVFGLWLWAVHAAPFVVACGRCVPLPRRPHGVLWELPFCVRFAAIVFVSRFSVRSALCCGSLRSPLWLASLAAAAPKGRAQG